MLYLPEVHWNYTTPEATPVVSAITHGLSSPVLVPAEPCWTTDYSGVTVGQLAGLSDEQLATVDPLVVNLLVAKEIPELAELDLAHYQEQVNSLAEDFRSRYLPYWQQSFQHEPHCYQNEIRFFCMGMISQYLRQEVGVKYIPEQRGRKKIRYENPSDLFLNGVLDTFLGTCGNIPTLALAIGWRMGWSVSLACVHGHHVLRYDDGDYICNIEVTADLPKGFAAPEDHNLIEDYEVPAEAITCGSDIKALTPRERLGLFLYLKSRHLRDRALQSGEHALLYSVESDLMLSRHLFPSYRRSQREALFFSALLANERFAPGEAGHTDSFPEAVHEVRQYQLAMQRNRQTKPQLRDSSDDRDCTFAGVIDSSMEL